MESSNIQGILIAGVIVLAFVGIFGYSIISKRKRKADSWTGLVMDKKIQEHVHGSNSGNTSGTRISFGRQSGGVAVTSSYDITVKADDGREIHWPISSGLYESIQIGDRLSKELGTEIPTVIEKSQTQAVTEISSPPQNSTGNNSTPPTTPFNPTV